MAARFVVPYLTFLFGSEGGEWEIIDTGNISPQHPNEFDCGIFVIHTISCILSGGEISVVTAPPSNFRNTVLQWIFKLNIICIFYSLNYYIINLIICYTQLAPW